MPNEMYDPAALDASDTLDGDPGDDPLDKGVAPPDRWSAGEGFGTTAEEEQEGESLDQLLGEEEPEPDPYADSDDEDDEDDDDEDRRAADLWGDDEPEPRSGRLVADDEGAHADDEEDLVAHDVGIDGGAASAEEAAVHIQDEDEG
jgi:hypothetical protein